MITINYRLNDNMLCKNHSANVRRAIKDELSGRVHDNFPEANFLITDCQIACSYQFKVVGDHLTKDEKIKVKNGVENIANEFYVEGQWTKIELN